MLHARNRAKLPLDLTSYLVRAVVLVFTPALGALWLMDKLIPKSKSDMSS